jgi:hemolysin III
MESYTRKQEVVNGLIHGFGMLFGISGLPVLVAIATANNNIPGIIGAGIYGFCFLMLFTASTIFHIAQEPAIKRLFMKLDHISIYFLIAGTYTPFLLVFLNNAFGNSLLVVLWSLALIGIFFKTRFTGRYDIVSTIIYLAMGWIMVVGGRRFFNAMPGDVLLFIFLGGALYSVGVIFYLWDKYMYTHAVWHSFVLGAAICHYVAVLLTI